MYDMSDFKSAVSGGTSDSMASNVGGSAYSYSMTGDSAQVGFDRDMIVNKAISEHLHQQKNKGKKKRGFLSLLAQSFKHKKKSKSTLSVESIGDYEFDGRHLEGLQEQDWVQDYSVQEQFPHSKMFGATHNERHDMVNHIDRNCIPLGTGPGIPFQKVEHFDIEEYSVGHGKSPVKRKLQVPVRVPVHPNSDEEPHKVPSRVNTPVPQPCTPRRRPEPPKELQHPDEPATHDITDDKYNNNDDIYHDPDSIFCKNENTFPQDQDDNVSSKQKQVDPTNKSMTHIHGSPSFVKAVISHSDQSHASELRPSRSGREWAEVVDQKPQAKPRQATSSDIAAMPRTAKTTPSQLLGAQDPPLAQQPQKLNLTHGKSGGKSLPKPKPRRHAIPSPPRSARRSFSPGISMGRDPQPVEEDKKTHFLVVEVVYQGVSLNNDEKDFIQGKMAQLVEEVLQKKMKTMRDDFDRDSFSSDRTMSPRGVDSGSKAMLQASQRSRQYRQQLIPDRLPVEPPPPRNIHQEPFPRNMREESRHRIARQNEQRSMEAAKKHVRSSPAATAQNLAPNSGGGGVRSPMATTTSPRTGQQQQHARGRGARQHHHDGGGGGQADGGQTEPKQQKHYRRRIGRHVSAAADGGDAHRPDNSAPPKPRSVTPSPGASKPYVRAPSPSGSYGDERYVGAAPGSQKFNNFNEPSEFTPSGPNLYNLEHSNLYNNDNTYRDDAFVRAGVTAQQQGGMRRAASCNMPVAPPTAMRRSSSVNVAPTPGTPQTANPMRRASSCNVGKSLQRSPTDKGANDHDAWWMPDEWARDRSIGVYGRGWKFDSDVTREREIEKEVARGSNVEKIRTSNFIRW